MARGSSTFTFIESAERHTTVPLDTLRPRIATIAADLRARLPQGAIVGLIFRSEPILVLAWLACIQAGMRPLVMQYPTKKQSRLYWLDSVSNTIARGGLTALVCDAHCASLDVGRLTETIVLPPLDAIAEAALDARALAAPLLPADFAIVQLSSGTTGFRKAVEFRAADLRQHVADYNKTLRLHPARDKIVSWLPLYHDMGYVACFVMPLLLGVDVVMMDPMVWVQNPSLLFDAAEQHGGTVAYLPNFGFEVMARCPPRPLPSMRLWVSCSEPVSATTSRRFLERIGAPPRSFAACYAMAENIFAVSFAQGLRTQRIEERDVVSCGAPIANVALKVVEEELWVRSPTSLRAYLGGEDIRDADGFYPTGDLARIIDGEVYVTGRKQDLLIQAGRKFMLSDIDLAVNEAFPEVKGRVATVQVYDERLGTQKPLVLIEAQDFFRRTDQDSVAEVVRGATGLDQVDVGFVPPRFLTKTSSGKINRKKSAQDWLACRAAPASEEGAATQPGAAVEAELRHYFGHVDWQAPVGSILDSLSLTVLRIILSDAGLPYRPEQSLDDILRAATSSGPDESAAEEHLYIVSIADSGTISYIKPHHLELLSRRLGVKVVLEHVCLPPSAVILSDLVFQDWFLPRVDRADYAVVERQLNKLRRASLIIADDVSEMLFPPAQVYNVLSHGFERDPRADLVSVRWQRYPQMHHRLPVTVVSGSDLPFRERSGMLERLGAYLRTPIFRIAALPSVAAFTEGWEHRLFEGREGRAHPRHYVQPAVLMQQLAAFIAGLPTPPRRRRGTAVAALETSDLAHFCSRIVDPAAVEQVLGAFDRFCIVGHECSVPYAAKRLEALGKSYVRAPSYSPDVLRPLDDAFDAILICGAQGRYAIEKPAVALMAADSERQSWNFEDDTFEKLTIIVPSQRAPASGTDWYTPFAMQRDADSDAFVELRQSVREFRTARRRRVVARRQAAAPQGQPA